jgi:hypothetical protein
MAGDAAFDLSQFNKKRILQEMNQYLFEGANPKLKWSDDRSTLSVILDHDCVYNFTCDVSKGPISRVDRMIFEESSAERVIEELLTSSPYQYALRTWLAMRLNRENEPFVWASTASIIEHVKDSGVRMLVFVDVENVPDFKKRFYSDSSGAIRFTSPYIPKLLVAPSLSDVNDDALAQASPVGLTRGTSDNSDLHEYTDENVLVLAYAHAGATISNYANRIISSLRPNAADGMNCEADFFPPPFITHSLTHSFLIAHFIIPSSSADGLGRPRAYMWRHSWALHPSHGRPLRRKRAHLHNGESRCRNGDRKGFSWQAGLSLRRRGAAAAVAEADTVAAGVS